MAELPAMGPQHAAHPALSILQRACASDDNVVGLMLLGSTARGEALARSDLDLAIVARPTRRKDVAAGSLRALEPTFVERLTIPAKGKHVLFSSDLRHKVDLFIIEDIHDVGRYIAGSRIQNIADAILLDRTGDLAARVATIPPEADDFDALVDEHLTRFASYFEAASSNHARSDMYRAHFSLGVAIQSLAALAWLAEGRRGFLWSPPDLHKVLPADLREKFTALILTMRPDEFHAQKQAVLDFACAVVTRLGLVDDPRIGLCEEALERDRFWNHRDAAWYSDRAFTQGVLFRGSSPHRYAADEDYRRWMKEAGITVRIDLRGTREKQEAPVPEIGIRTVEAAVDPWNDFKKDDPLREDVSRSEASYRFTALRCTHALRAVVEEVARGEGAVFVHCHAGSDRTGVIVALVQLLAGGDVSAVISGYSGSSDLERTGMLRRTLALVDAHGGVEDLARSAGLAPSTIALFRDRMRA